MATCIENDVDGTGCQGTVEWKLHDKQSCCYTEICIEPLTEEHMKGAMGGLGRRRMQPLPAPACMNYDVKTAAAGCTAPPLPTPQSSTLQLDSLTTMWLDYMCCKAVSSPPTEWPTNIHHWTQACTHVLALRATQHQTNTSHAHDDMTRFCPNNVPEDDLVLWLIDTIRPVMQANNPHWQRTVPDAHTQCSTVPHNAPATVTVLLTDTADISHLSLLIHTNGSVLGTPSEHDTSAYVSWGPRLGGWGEDVAAVTRTLTLYGGSTAAMLSEWETIKAVGPFSSAALPI